MTEFALLPPTPKLAVSFLLYLSELFISVFFLYGCLSKRTVKGYLRDVPVFVLLALFVSVLTASSYEAAGSGRGFRFPWIFPVVLSASVIVYCASGMVKDAAERKKALSPFSVKQALDDLRAGICFSDRDGRIVLINRSMLDLVYGLSGTYPQMTYQITEAFSPLKAPDESDGASGGLYRLPDGRVINLSVTPLSRLEGFSRISAYDVTEIYLTNLSLRTENEKLKETNEKLNSAYERLSDRIREQETLELKIRVHNDIGAALISISEMLQNGGDVGSQLSELKNAAGYFCSKAPSSDLTLDRVKLSAADRNVTFVHSGVFPTDPSAAKIIVYAAFECVNNCVKHAGGDKVSADITQEDGYYTAVFKNTGKRPESGITEGGGLSGIRAMTEEAGGSMTVVSEPEFALILKIPYKERNV